jgi:hypothetical protein
MTTTTEPATTTSYPDWDVDRFWFRRRRVDGLDSHDSERDHLGFNGRQAALLHHRRLDRHPGRVPAPRPVPAGLSLQPGHLNISSADSGASDLPGGPATV